MDDLRLMGDWHEFPPPEGCEYANGEFVVGSVLETKDGRQTGNAIIVERTVNDDLDYVFTIETDFGNKIFLTEHEISSVFHPPRYKCPISRWKQDRAEKQSTESCYECKHFILCFLRRRIWDSLCGVQIISENTHVKLFKAIRDGCSEFAPREEGGE